MNFQEEVGKLQAADREKLVAMLESQGVNQADFPDLLSFKIVLQGQKFHGTVTPDFAHSLWELQRSYYRMVAAVKYGSPTATLSAEEKEEHLLVFKIENGSTHSIADLSDSFWDLACKLADKMEPWQILVLVAVLAGAYVGGKWVVHQADVKKRQAEIDADVKKRQAEIEADVKKHQETAELFSKMLDSQKEALEIVSSAGASARTAILRGVSGIEKASIGGCSYGAAEIGKIRRRATRVKSKSETRIMNVVALDILARDKDKPTVVLLDKDTGTVFKAEVSLEVDEDSPDVAFNEAALNTIWDSARYPDRHFWAEISVVLSRDKIIDATILAAAENKDDLPESAEMGSGEFDF